MALGTVNVGRPMDPAEYVKSVLLAAANGVATLDDNGKLQPSQKPSYSKSEIGLGNVDNTSDADKPVSVAQADAIGSAVKDVVYADEDSVDTSAEVINADTLGGKQPSEFAPAGYGLGASAKVTGDLDQFFNCGWYYYSTSTLKTTLPAGFGNGVFEVINRNNSHWIQKLIDVNGHKIQRTYKNDIWGEWEWDNPPMVMGVEYRTTERWNDKVVYAKLIDFGTLPNTATKAVGSGSKAANIVSFEGIASGPSGVRYSFPMFVSGGLKAYAYIASATGDVSVTTTDDRSTFTAYFIVKYTKD